MRFRHVAIAGALLLALAGAAGFAVTQFGGFSARAQPTLVERVAARILRRSAVPRQARAAKNPVPFSPEVWSDARAHFADHCATCHANDGSGRTEIGQNLYPKALDMRLADTQNLSDGELYWIIENGIRLTGMPAWGTGRDNNEDTWKLVHFIRRLKDLTPEQLDGMAALNPKTAAERKEEEDDNRFLSGQELEPSPPDAAHHQHKE